MDISSLSMNMNALKLQNQVSLSVLKLAMDTSGDLAQNMVEELIELPAASTGHIDVYI